MTVHINIEITDHRNNHHSTVVGGEIDNTPTVFELKLASIMIATIGLIEESDDFLKVNQDAIQGRAAKVSRDMMERGGPGLMIALLREEIKSATSESEKPDLSELFGKDVQIGKDDEDKEKDKGNESES